MQAPSHFKSPSSKERKQSRTHQHDEDSSLFSSLDTLNTSTHHAPNAPKPQAPHNNRPTLKVRLINFSIGSTSRKFPSFVHKDKKRIAHPFISIYGKSIMTGKIDTEPQSDVTPLAMKACVHLHGVFPYFYVEKPPASSATTTSADNGVNPTRPDTSINQMMQFANSLEKALGRVCIHSVTEHTMTPFYGYFNAPIAFWKVEFASPWEMKKAAEYVAQHWKWQIYEAHFPFLLQVFMDSGLMGCGWLEAIKWSVPTEKQSTCNYEFDVHINNVLNRMRNESRWRKIASSLQTSAGTMTFNSPTVANPHVKLVNSLAQIWEEEKKRRRANNLSTQFTQHVPSQRDVHPFDYDQILQQKVDQMINHLDIHFASQPITTGATTDKQNIPYSTQEDINWMEQEEEYEAPHDEQDDEDLFEDEDNPLHNEEMTDIMTATQEVSSMVLGASDDDSEEEEDEDFLGSEHHAPFIPQFDGAFDSFEPSTQTPRRSHAGSPPAQRITSGTNANPSSAKKHSSHGTNAHLPSAAPTVRHSKPIPALKSILRTSTNFGRAALHTNQQQPQLTSHNIHVTFDKQPPVSYVYYNIGDQVTHSGNTIAVVTQILPHNELEVLEFVRNSPHARELVLINESKRIPTTSISGSCLIVPQRNFHAVAHHPNAFYCEFFSHSKDESIRYPIHTGLKQVVWPSSATTPAASTPVRPRILFGAAPTLKSTTLRINAPPPTAAQTAADLNPHVIPEQPSYSNLNDDVQNLSQKSQVCTILPPASKSLRFRLSTPPPSSLQVQLELQKENNKDVKSKHQPKARVDQMGRLIMPSQSSSNASLSAKLGGMTRELAEDHDISCFIVELLIKTRSNLSPDPEYDSVEAIFYCYQEERSGIICQNTGCIALDKYHSHSFPQVNNIQKCATELELIQRLVHLVHQFDPDILLGYEIQKLSWGYLVDRCTSLRLPPLEEQLSRRKPTSKPFNKKEDTWGKRKQSGINVDGRTMLNIWRLLRGALKLRIYNIQNTAYHCLKKQYPHIPWETLSSYIADPNARTVRTAMWHIFSRCLLSLRLMDHLDIIRQTAELAQLYGIEFFSVHNRGSQYQVESVMCRIAKSMGYAVVSPTRHQVATADAIEAVPLVMEPRSSYYSNPVLVLDFQSLYPSIIIAYNLCFSTCLGKIVNTQRKRLGAISNYSIPDSFISSIKKDVFISPNAAMFVKSNVRQGVLPRMLQEILDTRVMLKRSMKTCQDSDPVMYRVLNAQQFGLKMIANVTYGYTAASFSGRMPMSCLADAIVQLGRETLEKTISTIHENASKWMGARVVYGDTDSVFVEVPGATKEDAFRIGREIAQTVTKQNPQPMCLQFEKVYYPCVLVTKKRYVGYSFESESQSEPLFDAKGVECVRRDNCPMVAKMMEKSLRILFDTNDLSRVKRYVVGEWEKLLRGQYSVKDYIFAKEVKLGSYRGPTLPPGAIVAQQKMKHDPRSEPLYKERVPYVVVFSDPHARLVDMVVDPWKLIEHTNTGLMIHAHYYITKQVIPALGRIFSLVSYEDPNHDGLRKTVDILQWFLQMPKYQKSLWVLSAHTLDSYFTRSKCALCQGVSRNILCERCSQNVPHSVSLMLAQSLNLEKHQRKLNAICMGCVGTRQSYATQCSNLTCDVMFERRRVKQQEAEFESNVEAVKKEHKEMFESEW